MLKIALILVHILIANGSLDPEKLEYHEKKIYKPPLEEVRLVLEESLKKNFAQVSVEIVDCPDLTKDPFYLASSGLVGDGTIIEYGNTKYLLPLPDKSKVYDLITSIRRIDGFKEKDFFVCGAGAGPFPLINQNSEGIYNLKVHANGSMINEGYLAKIVASGMELQKFPNNETRAAILGNLFLSEGKAGKVIKVVAKNRFGEENFISSMQKGLTQSYPTDKIIGLGGAFVMNGKANIHVMDKFSEIPINTDEELNSWLKFFDMPGPLICLGNYVSQQTDYELRFQHFHCFSKHGYGGHYHYDTTPDTVEYEGYFNIAERIVLIDKNSAISVSSKIALISKLLLILMKFLK